MFGKARHGRGFSIVELAIIMAIVGLVVGVVLQSYRYFVQHAQVNNTFTNVRVAFAPALANYIVNFGSYPCPAGGGVPIGNPGSGAGAGTGDPTDCAAFVAAHPPPFCDAGAVSPTKGLCTVKAPSGKTILIGSVPYYDIGLSIKQSLDGWGNRLIYAVTYDLTQRATVDAFVGSGAALENLGGITVKYIQRAGSTYSVVNQAYKPATPALPNGFPFVIYSAGANGKGAYTYSGFQIPCTGQGLDLQNCSNTASFIEPGSLPDRGAFSTAPGANYYDDVSMLDSPDLGSDKWVITGKNQMRNKNAGSVGISNYNPTTGFSFTSKNPVANIPFDMALPTSTWVNNPPLDLGAPRQYELDVAGEMTVAQAHSDAFCDDTGLNCFTPQPLFNSKSCTNGFITGIANGDVICSAGINTQKITGASSCTGSNLLTGFKKVGGNVKLMCQP